MIIRRVLPAVFTCLMISAAVTAAEDPGEALDRLEKVLKADGQASEKKAALAEVAKIKTMRALKVAAAAAANKEVAEAAVAAAGIIAGDLTSPDQPPYVRRSAFLRLLGCQPKPLATQTAIKALRGKDVVLQTCAIGFLRTEAAQIDKVVAQLASFPPEAQESILQVVAERGDAAPLIEMSRNKDKGTAAAAVTALVKLGGEKALARVGETLADKDLRAAALGSLARWPDASPLPLLIKVVRESKDQEEKAVALSGIARLAATGKPDKAAQQNLLTALNLVTGGEVTEKTATVGVEIAESLSPSHPAEARKALDKLAASGKLSGALNDRVRATLISATIGNLTNLAIGAKASSPDGHNSDGPRPDAHAIDGKKETYWDETDGHKLYRLRVDLKEPANVSAILIMGWAHHNFSPKDFEIVCDDKTVKTVKNAKYTDNRLIVCFPRTKCSSLELKITGCYGGSPGVRELGIYDPEAPKKK
jgi:hypothetical protein